jgi:phenylalanyl-tRNA synthetase beta chain
MLGLEVESVETTGMKQLNNVVVGEILSRDPHPNADKLGVCMVKVNPDADPVQIVCGAKNYKVGDRVPVALDGAKLPTADGGIFEIKVSQLRGVTSNGMMCSARELGMGTDHSGLLILEMRPEIGTPINDVFTESDTVFEIELTANRGDCLSHIGVARELAAKFGKKLIKPELKYNPVYTDKPTGNLVDSIESQTPNCPLYTAVSIKGVKVAPSPEWLRRDIESVGLRSINNVVDVTNYVLMEYGQPLHSFDASKIRGKKIVVRQAQDGEEIQTLDEKKYTLTSEATLICDGEGAVALAGVMGGLNSEVSNDTTDVVLESAWFNPGNVRATSRKYAINTDSSDVSVYFFSSRVWISSPSCAWRTTIFLPRIFDASKECNG